MTMIIKRVFDDSSRTEAHLQEENDVPQEDYDWDDPNLQAIDWSKVEIEGEPYDGPRGDPSVYSDIVDVSKLRHAQNESNETRKVDGR